METVQLALSNSHYANQLRETLLRNGSYEVLLVDSPDPGRGGVLVVDPEHMDSLTVGLHDPERIVLVAPKSEAALERAWEMGVQAVVFDKDPLNTAVLAIMSAGAQLWRPKRIAYATGK
jgi:hypothetical protein